MKLQHMQILLELSLAVDRSQGFEKSTRRSLSVLLRKLNCAAGQILRYHPANDGPGRLESVQRLPMRATDDLFGAVCAHIPQAPTPERWRRFLTELPLQIELDDNEHQYALHLPEFGVLLLQTRRQPIDKSVLVMLPPVLDNFTAAWNNAQRREELRHKTEALARSRTALLNVMQDMKQTNLALRRSERQYRLLAENADDVIWTLSADLKLTYVTPSIRKLTGYTAAQWLAMKPTERYTPASWRALRAAIAREQATGSQDTARTMVDVQVRHARGHQIWAEVLVSGILRDDGRPSAVIGVVRDITDRRQAEQEKLRAQEQLQQSQKMETIGRLAGGVAHDFNNLLSVIMGQSELLHRDADCTPKQRQRIEQIFDASERARALTQQLLMFSRKQVIKPRALDWNEQIEHSLQLYRRLIGEDIEIAFQPATSAPPILADPQQLDQILANLLVNARDALHELDNPTAHRAIHISTHVTAQLPPEVVAEGGATGPFACLQVRDTGVGMDEETLDKLFEPFFTTKAAGRGTGLGLATVLGAVNQNKGAVHVDSRPGMGATFRIYWPAAPHAQLDPDPVTRPIYLDLDVEQGEEHILLVEDEDQIREWAAESLRGLNYTVTTAANAEQALTRLARAESLPDMLLTDIVMPGMNGKQLADRVRKSHPEMDVLFMSGYTADAIDHYGVGSESVDLLEKPFTTAELAARVRDVLGRGRGERRHHARPSRTTAPAEPSAEALPEALRQSLRDAIEMGHVTLIEELIEDATDYDALLAGELTRLVDRFDYGSMLAVLSE